MMVKIRISTLAINISWGLINAGFGASGWRTDRRMCLVLTAQLVNELTRCRVTVYCSQTISSVPELCGEHRHNRVSEKWISSAATEYIQQFKASESKEDNEF